MNYSSNYPPEEADDSAVGWVISFLPSLLRHTDAFYHDKGTHGCTKKGQYRRLGEITNLELHCPVCALWWLPNQVSDQQTQLKLEMKQPSFVLLHLACWQAPLLRDDWNDRQHNNPEIYERILNIYTKVTTYMLRVSTLHHDQIFEKSAPTTLIDNLKRYNLMKQ